MINEEWKAIKGYEGLYEISNFGRVKSLPKMKGLNTPWPETIMSPNDNGRGYKCVRLSKESNKKGYYLHRLVAQHFITNPNPYIYDEINHKDGDKSNNHISNLEWSNRRMNEQHARQSGLKKPARIITGMNEEGTTLTGTLPAICAEYAYDYSFIAACANGKRKTAYGKKWKWL